MGFDGFENLLAAFAPVGVFHTDAEGNCVHVNDLWCSLTGLDRAAAMGRGWLDAVYPEDREWVARAWYKSSRQDPPVMAEFRFLTPAGKVVWVIVRAAAKHDAAGAIVGHLGIVMDITARKLLELKLTQKEHDLSERIKELHFLYYLSEIIGSEDSLDSVFRKVVEHIPEAFEHPEMVAARLEVGARVFESGAWTNSGKVASFPLGDSESVGRLSVEIAAPGGFLPEEHDLVGAVAERLGRVIERESALAELQRARVELEERVERRTRQLRESEEVTRALLDASTERMFLLDRDGRVLAANRSFAESFDKPLEALLGRDIFSILPHERKEPRRKVFRTVMETRAPLRVEDERDGHILDNHHVPILDDRGEVRRIAIFSHDITEERNLIKALAVERDLGMKLSSCGTLHHAMAAIIDAVKEISSFDSGGIYAIDQPTGNLFLVAYQGLSEGFAEPVSFYPRDSWNYRVVMEGKARFVAAENSPNPGTVKTEGLRAVAVLPIRYQGAVIACLNLGSRSGMEDSLPVRDALEMMASQLGATLVRVEAEEKLRREEDALKRSEEKYRILFECDPDMVALLDLEGRIVMVNQSGMEALGVIPEELRGRKFSELGFFDEDNSKWLSSLLPRVCGGETIIPYEIELNGPRGGGRWFEVFTTIIPLASEPSLIQVIARDITARKQAETEREQRAEEMIRAQKLESIGTLAGGIAHDFNNILMSVLGNVSLLRLRPDIDPEMEEILSDLEQGAYRARDLTRQLITFAKGGTPVKKMVAVGEMARQAAELAVRGSRARCSFTIDRGLPEVQLDEGQVSQVVHNIVTNAAQAMPDGGVVEVRVSPARLEADAAGRAQVREGDFVLISVTDSGPGISAEVMPRIFDPYFTTRDAGSGLGLATAYAIIKKHEGCLLARSTPGRGATFEVYLPSAGRPERKAARRPSRRSAARVLVMDDEETVRLIAGRMLKKLGYASDHAADGAEAVRMYQRALIAGKPYLAVILDLTVAGGMGGKEAVRLLREIDPEVCAIVSSGYSEDPILANYLDYGFVARLPKPYRVEDIAAEMDKLPHPARG